MKYRVHHRTIVHYDGPVRLARFNLRLEPAAVPGQKVERYLLTVQPPPSRIENRNTHFPVKVQRVVIGNPLSTLVVDSRFDVVVDDAPAPVAQYGDLTIAAVSGEALLVDDLAGMAPANYLFASPRVPLDPVIGDWATETLATDRPIVAAVLELALRIKAEFAYVPGATDAHTPVFEAFEARRGVCQDFAHIMLVMLRMAGLPAAYVSGYIRTYPPPGRPRLLGADATHAWVMLWCGAARGWIGFDPTNGVTAGPDHIFVAMGRDYDDVLPMDGMFIGPSGQDLDVAVDVMPLDADDSISVS